MVKPLRAKPKASERSDAKLWENVPWDDVDMPSEGFGDSVFFGLEEIDGNAYMKAKGITKPVAVATIEPVTEKIKKKRKLVEHTGAGDESECPNVDEGLQSVTKVEKKQKQQKKLKVTAVVKEAVVFDPNATGIWGENITLHVLLKESLELLNFTTPTPIQVAAIPMSMKLTKAGGNFDIVGAAETGSGKTLAFALPILNELLKDWNIVNQSIESRKLPFAMIIAPTRELVLQICTVLKDVCRNFQSTCKIEIAAVVGGMSEDKQRRQLSGILQKPLHLLVATPGRLCEMMNDENIPAFRDMSYLRYLVVDEADRIVEEGHFPELHRVFSRIRDHEKVAEQDVAKAKQQETEASDASVAHEQTIDGMENADTEAGGDASLEAGVEETEEEEEEQEYPMDHMADKACSVVASAYRGLRKRQTFLFSATAVQAQHQVAKQAASGKKVKGLACDGRGMTDSVRQLSFEMQELLAAVAIQRQLEVIDVITDMTKKTKQDKKQSNVAASSATTSSSAANVMDEQAHTFTLPKTLKQMEICMPAEDKDVFAYFYLLKNSGRTLLFVNSIKTARRVDGLLRALGINCRTIHAQLQQRQRLKALDSFRSSPIGVLVATDVAARGLDIPMIQSVLHYDVARSAQVYVHRSGRTARASASGSSVSLVAPEDAVHHAAINAALGMKNMPPLPVDAGALTLLRERVKLAKKIFTQSFVSSQKHKQKTWLDQSAEEADIELDEYMKVEEESEEQLMPKKKDMDRARSQLKKLLDTPIELGKATASSRRRGFVVVAN